MEPREDLLTDVANLEMASSTKRLGNYLIDVVVFYLLALTVGVFIGLMNPGALDSMDDSSMGFNLMDRLITLVCYGFYMGVVEAVFKGKSLGKLITGTRAVNEDGSVISTATAFKRGLARAVPFNVFSALGNPCYPWQDKWTDTYVVDVKKSILPAETA